MAVLRKKTVEQHRRLKILLPHMTDEKIVRDLAENSLVEVHTKLSAVLALRLADSGHCTPLKDLQKGYDLLSDSLDAAEQQLLLADYFEGRGKVEEE